MKHIVYYHIFVNPFPESVRLVEEQLDTIKNSSIYPLIECVMCCITGNNKPNFDHICQKVATLGNKFKIKKSQLNDTTGERFTLTELLNDAQKDTAYLYIHSKGITRINQPHMYACVTDWRKCMEFFLITHGERYLYLLENHDTLGIFKHPTYKLPHYSGNFWWARGDYLIALQQTSKISDDYLGPEMFILSSGTTRAIDLYPLKSNYNGYTQRLPPKTYNRWRKYIDDTKEPLNHPVFKDRDLNTLIKLLQKK